MSRFTKTLLVVSIICCFATLAFADKGVGKKSKAKTTLNIKTPSSLRNSIKFNLKSGLSYKGSLLAVKQTANGSIMTSNLVTYQKGNTTYIIPQKTKVVVTDVQQGYTGLKLIIKHK